MPKTVRTARQKPAKPRTRGRKPTKLRGLLPVPHEVSEIVDRETARLPMTKEARQRLENELTLQYHCDGEVVAYRFTGAGVELRAVGIDEVGDYFDALPRGQIGEFAVRWTDPWGSL